MHGSIGNRPLNSRFDPDSPLGGYSQCTVRPIRNPPADLASHGSGGGNTRLTSTRTTWTRPGLPPERFYRLLAADACSGSGPSAGLDPRFGNDVSNKGVSPVALPHKALALLGMQEASGFGLPSSPEPWDVDLQSEFADDSDSDESQHHSLRQLRPQQRPPIDPPPERLYFGAKSLCSAFSAASERTRTPATSQGRHVPDNAAGDMTMLNLEDTDDDASPTHRVAAGAKGRAKGKGNGKVRGKIKATDDAAAAAGGGGGGGGGAAERLPLEIRLRICEYFVEEMHQEDLVFYNRRNDDAGRRPGVDPQASEAADEACQWDPECDRRCPNCRMHALWALSLVSRSWSKAARQTLYRSVSLDFGTFTTNSLTGASEFAAHSSCRFRDQHRHDVEFRLQCLYRTIWESGGDIGHQIRTIRLPRAHFSVSRYPLSAILLKCPNLESLDCALVSGSAPDLVAVLSKLTQMRRWAWMRQPDPVCGRRNSPPTQLSHRKPPAAPPTPPDPRHGPPQTVALEVLPLWENLQSLELRFLHPAELPDAFDFRTLPALTHLILHRVLLKDREGRSDGFMGRLPHLRRLEIDGCENIDIKPIVSYVAARGSGLTHLRLRVPDILPIYVLYQLLASTPRIIDFSAAVYTSSGPTAYSPPRPPTASPPPEHIPPLPSLRSLERINLDVAPLREALELLLQLLVRIRQRRSDSAVLSPLPPPPSSSSSSLKVMKLGFSASGKSPWLGEEGDAMDRDEMRSEVRLRTECLFNDVKLIFYEGC